ncbi:head decoration protein [Roseibium alexandrii]|uniref:Bacteriophage lambda head decoration protein D n=1 Tax=Roseibium alexandrii (strain DSM 17067 / NCIMB 14079 / DFL-11) TaxID=244592 RepID=A0A5E8H0Z3_ROSAD|nr:head decoration protein [Roseibium alexandrii]EEE46079.1 hypothetical protein SADFL11_3368 [Roseibium alexandrii DFL-11]
MTVLTEKAGPGSCIIMEGEHGYSRDTGTVIVPNEQTYLANTVLGQVTANKNYVQWAPGAADGSESVAAILIYPASGTSEKSLLVRLSQVKSQDLVMPEGATPAQIETAHAELEVLGIIVR